MAKWAWVKDMGRGGIPLDIQEETRRRILAHAGKRIPEKASQIRIRFQGAFCYVDAEELDSPPLTHLCRLRYEGDPNAWSLAFYTYSHEAYQACVFGSGERLGTPEEALEIGAVYLG